MAAFVKRWGLSTRKKLKKTSPFASLCLEIGAAISEEELSSLRLAITVDKIISRRKMSTVKNAPDLLRLLLEEQLIAQTDTHFLEHLLSKVGRKDLEKLIEKYHAKRTECENTPPSESTEIKAVFGQPFTRLKQPSQDMTVMKDVHTYQSPPMMKNTLGQDEAAGHQLKPGRYSFCSFPLQQAQFTRPNPEGMSTPFSQDTISPKAEGSSPTNSLHEDGWSQMSVDSSQKSAMSISDDEKICYLSEKGWTQDLEENTCSV